MNAIPITMTAYTGGASVPSARFRLRQYQADLTQLGINVIETWPSMGCYPPASRIARPFWLAGSLCQRIPHLLRGATSDVSFIQREMISTLPTFEGFTKHPRVFDVDDAIHLFRNGRTAQALGAKMDLVLAGNAWLAEAWSQWSPNVHILPTAVDCRKHPLTAFPEHPVMGWIGTSSNLHCLEALAPAFRAVSQRIPNLQVLVCCDRSPNLPGVPVTFLPWSPDVEVSFFQSITLGLMPLEDNPWTKGKCSFKMLQYLASGRPCIASPYGMNADVIGQGDGAISATTLEDWEQALTSLLHEPQQMAERGIAGRRLIEAEYDVAVLAPRMAKLIQSLL